MKQNKKQFWNWKKAVYLFMMIIGIAIILNAIEKPFHNFSDRLFCHIYPDKCVCEYWKDKQGMDYTIQYITSEQYLNEASENDDICQRLRKKTTQELLIDDCNNNPREDDLCKCEGYGESKEDKMQCQHLFEIYNCSQLNISKGEFCICYSETVCTESRPKTECEKGNPDWVEETQVYSNGSGIFQTICREKTDVEKLMDKDCDWIFHQLILMGQGFTSSELDCMNIGYFAEKDCIQFHKLKQAWRQKGCQI